jgi:hypothetical protein
MGMCSAEEMKDARDRVKAKSRARPDIVWEFLKRILINHPSKFSNVGEEGSLQQEIQIGDSAGCHVCRRVRRKQVRIQEDAQKKSHSCRFKTQRFKNTNIFVD